MRINGAYRPDGSFIGFDYENQNWYETGGRIGNPAVFAGNPGSASNPIPVIPTDAEIIPD